MYLCLHCACIVFLHFCVFQGYLLPLKPMPHVISTDLIEQVFSNIEQIYSINKYVFLTKAMYFYVDLIGHPRLQTVV